jgi:hypothetical protein
MTGPEHYREADRLQAHAQELLVTEAYDAEESLQRAAAVLADAQVRATLAMASVLGLSSGLRGGPASLGETGYPEDPRIRMLAWRDKNLPDWLRLAFDAAESDLEDPERQQAWLTFVHDTVENLNPAFGVIDYEYDGLYGEAAAESTIKTSYMLQHQRIPRSREQLRGYDWLTICPQELADRLGGTEALRATRAFHEVAQLSGGGVWLLATADYPDFDNAALYRVFRALAPVLPIGMPEHAG